jgi:hypothetical protein
LTPTTVTDRWFYRHNLTDDQEQLYRLDPNTAALTPASESSTLLELRNRLRDLMARDERPISISGRER